MKDNNDSITILNYPGSKKRLLPFIKNVISKYLGRGKVVFDIFAGTHAVGYALKDSYKVIANDAEIYSYIIGKCLITNKNRLCLKNIQDVFDKKYSENYNKLALQYPEYVTEQELISKKDIDGLIEFYNDLKNIWECGYINRFSGQKNNIYHLFTTYYSNTYFGLKHSMQIDSIRYAIEQFKNTENYYYLMTALFFAMKECVFSKDGHMAQPLDRIKNKKILLKRREKNLLDIFLNKLAEFQNINLFKTSNNDNVVLNLSLNEIFDKNSLINTDLIYADPPYTDMQYSRYYHLLETVTRYDYPKLSYYRGKISKGLYRENRFQSPLSQHSSAKADIDKLIQNAKRLHKIIIFSYAYPIDPIKQKSDRYTMTIDDLIGMFKKHFGESVYIEKETFAHCNNSTKEVKKVYEYLIIGVPNE